MAILTLIYVLISFFALLAIKRQAEIADKNAEAVIHAERAWIMAEVNQFGHSITYGSGTDGNTIAITVIFNSQNTGKSPAWITERWLDTRLPKREGSLNNTS